MKKFFVGVGVFLLVISPYIIGKAITTSVVAKTTQDIKGYVATREAYVPACTRNAMLENAPGLTTEIATAYCGCVYDKGVAQFGAETFTNMDLEATRTNTLTPEMNALVNACVAQVIGG